MNKIKEVLMDRDDLSGPDADDQIKEAKAQLLQYLADGNMCAAEDICAEYFSLEPDYIFDLI